MIHQGELEAAILLQIQAVVDTAVIRAIESRDHDITLAAQMAAAAAVDEVSERYGLEPKHFVYLKELHEKRTKVGDSIRNALIVAFITAVISVTGLLLSAAPAALMHSKEGGEQHANFQ
ncbi:hypothetical protein EDC56_1248 [Sinobacterium caligoides]|uniref:Uncharacterized protein n=1 Tax=Sinobacterium caligoides TaxID=933926 RepID=A0A3N2E1Z2_9GAMM|nr:hypothetical protein [Sinobacterium caligoides]ROS05699.1 hypothetical protein EDC56_1248 [Sinobacterium caligoides]